MKSTVLGIGEWRPPHVRLNSDWAPEVIERWKTRTAGAPPPGAGKGAIDGTALSEAPELAEADRLSAIGFTEDMADPFLFATHRHVADASVSSIQGSAHAGKAALADAGIDAKDVDVVVCWDAVPDRPGCPGAPKVAELLGATKAHGFDLQQACASVISSLDLAAGLVESGRARYVLLTQSHLATRLIRFDGPVGANVGDIATAMLVGPSERPGILTTSIVSDGRFQDAVIIARGKDDETDTPWWIEGGPFVFGTKDRAGAQTMMKETVKMGALTIREACERGRMKPAELDVICAPHPRRWIPGAIAETLGLRKEQAPHTYQQTAHVGGCGAVANLLEARRRGMLRPGAKVAMYAQGQGMTRAAAILDWAAR